MKTKATVYLPNEKGDRPSITYEAGKDNVKAIARLYGGNTLLIKFCDDSFSEYCNMPFEVHSGEK